jgi:hypothetical protein
MFLGHYAAGNAGGDLNGDHAVDGSDLIILLTHFGHKDCTN